MHLPILVSGSLVCGEYVVERFVRRGPLASLYLARRRSGPFRRFHVRAVHAELAATGARRERLARAFEELRALRVVGVPTLEASSVDAATPVLVTEAPTGRSLRDIIAESAHARTGELVWVLGRLATILDTLHRGDAPLRAPLIHRRVCPENVSIARPERRVWLEECGLAHALGLAGALDDRSVSPTLPGYLTPDELRRAITPATDVFTLATVAYEWLTGTLPFEGSSHAALEAMILRGPRPGLRGARPELPRRVDEVLARAWSVDPVRAYPSASAFVTDLGAALGLTTRSMALPPPAIPYPPPLPPSTSADDRPTIPAIHPGDVAAPGSSDPATIEIIDDDPPGVAPVQRPLPQDRLTPLRPAPPSPAPRRLAAAALCVLLAVALVFEVRAVVRRHSAAPRATPTRIHPRPPGGAGDRRTTAATPALVEPRRELARAPAAGTVPPERPGPREIEALLERFRPALLACLTGTHGRGPLRIGVRFEGVSGQVLDARLRGPLARVAEGACALDALRALHVAPFARRQWETTLAFEVPWGGVWTPPPDAGAPTHE